MLCSAVEDDAQQVLRNESIRTRLSFQAGLLSY